MCKTKMLRAVLILVLFLYPFFHVVPSPSSNPSHPWFSELLASISLTYILLVWIKKAQIIKIDETRIVAVILFLPFVLYSFISLFWAKDVFSVFHFFCVWFIFLSLYLVFSHDFLTNNSAWINAFSLTIPLVSVICLIDLVSNHNLAGAGIDTFRIRYGKYAEIVASYAPFLLGLALQNRKSFIPMLASLTAVLGVTSSLSRGAFIALICGIVVFFIGVLFSSLKAYKMRAYVLLLLVSLILALPQVLKLFPLSTVEYTSNETLKTSDTTQVRLFFWKVSFQMIKENPLIGVGADNFWISFNDARASYNAENSLEDPMLGIAENYFVQRAHNEILQTTAELGLIGLTLFALPFIWLARLGLKTFASKKRLSPAVWGSISGMIAFLVSSMVSSFSFRFLASGITFFFLLAFFTHKISRNRRQTNKKLPFDRRFAFYLLPVAVFSVVVTASANIGNFLIKSGEESRETEKAEKLLKTASYLNPSNSTSYFALGLKYYSKRRFHEASQMFKTAILKGFDVDISRFYLASSHRAMGDLSEEEKILKDALKVYPRSIFLRVRLHINMIQQNRTEEANEELKTAIRINEKQAIGWLKLMTLGASEAGRQGMRTKEFIPPAELEPQEAMYSVIHEHEVLNLFPRNVN